MTTESLTIFLGWTTVINILVFIFSALVLLTAREKISKLHARLFGVEQANISQLYFQHLAQYKIAIIVFNIAPYLALRILA